MNLTNLSSKFQNIFKHCMSFSSVTLDLFRTGQKPKLPLDVIIVAKSVCSRKVGARGHCLASPPLNLKRMTSYAALVRNALKFSLTLSALAVNTLEFSLKKNANGPFLSMAHRKIVNFLVLVVLLRSGKISAGAHVCPRSPPENGQTISQQKMFVLNSVLYGESIV